MVISMYFRVSYLGLAHNGGYFFGLLKFQIIIILGYLKLTILLG